MNREILFRGRQVDNGEWFYGYLVNSHWYLNDKVATIIIPIDSTLYPHCELSSYEFVDPETVGQWTGLVDKNGVKIFEGDVVRYKQVSRFPSRIRDLDKYIKGDIGEYAFIHEWTGVVTYKNGEFTPRPYICACEDFYYSFGYCDFEVIGNIWDNPELGGK